MLPISNALRTAVTQQSTPQPEAAPQPAVVRPGDEFAATRTQARQPPSAMEQRIASKINDLVQRRFGGNWQAAFRHYAGRDGQVDREGVLRMLADAGVNFPPPSMVADRLMEKFDADRSGRISFGEFQTSMRNLGFRV